MYPDQNVYTNGHGNLIYNSPKLGKKNPEVYQQVNGQTKYGISKKQNRTQQ